MAAVNFNPALLYRLIPLLLSILVCRGQTTPAACEDGWLFYNGACYFIADDRKASQPDAMADCQSRHADLLILEIPEEVDFLVQDVAYANSDGWWTRLHRVLDTRFFVWDVDYPPDPSVIQWNKEPDNANGKENCGAINEQSAFSDEDCSQKMGFICQTTDTNCPAGWPSGNGKCFFISNTFDSKQLMTWQQAREKCGTLATGATLVDFSDGVDPQDILAVTLPEQTQTTIPWWTSLNRKQSQWYWGDTLASSTDNLKWLQEPNNLGQAENCGLLYGNGKMADKDCSLLANYICKKAENSVRTSEGGRLSCGAWKRGGNKCYYFENDFPEIHDIAQRKCLARGGDLLKIESIDEKNYIDYMTRYNNARYWTQLSAASSNGVWKFSDGSQPADGLVLWNIEPNDYSGVQDCVGIFPKQTWDDASCLMQAGYICEAINSGQNCPGNWTSYGGSCYFFGPNYAKGGKVNWWIARRMCKNMAEPLEGRLLSVDDPNELAWINTQLTARQGIGLFYWTGLNDVAAEGILVYDGVAALPRLDIVPWDIAPSCTSCSPDCSILVVGGYTADVECSSQQNYICERAVRAGAVGRYNLPYQTSVLFSTILALIITAS